MLHAAALLLPALIPSWRFFDEIAPSPRIEYRLLNAPAEALDQWQEFRPRPVRLSRGALLVRLVWNVRWNETLFLVTCAERLLESPSEYRAREIIRRIVRALAQGGEIGAAYAQFRLVVISRQGLQLCREVPFTSVAYPIEEVRL